MTGGGKCGIDERRRKIWNEGGRIIIYRLIDDILEFIHSAIIPVQIDGFNRT